MNNMETIKGDFRWADNQKTKVIFKPNKKGKWNIHFSFSKITNFLGRTQ